MVTLPERAREEKHMSHTDKTAPFRVQVAEGKIHHDHTTGECIIGEAWERFRWTHDCKKRVASLTFCTKAEPSYGCWKMTWNYAYDERGGMIFRTNDITGEVEAVLADEPYTWKRCTGHKTTVRDETITCSCDHWGPKPTCYREAMNRGRRWNVERGYKDVIEYNTPRSRQLATRVATREAIAEGFAEWEAEIADTSDMDFPECDTYYEADYYDHDVDSYVADPYDEVLLDEQYDDFFLPVVSARFAPYEPAKPVRTIYNNMPAHLRGHA